MQNQKHYLILPFIVSTLCRHDETGGCVSHPPVFPCRVGFRQKRTGESLPGPKLYFAWRLCLPWEASTVSPGGTEWVSHTLPPMTQPSPMTVLPPSTVAPA